MINTHNSTMNSKFRHKITFIYLNLRDMNNAKKIFKSLSTSCSATGTKDLSWNPDVPNSIKRSSAGSSSTSFGILRVSIDFMVVSYHSKPRICVCVFTFFVCASPCCWFLAAVLHRTLCVWHKLSRTVPVKYKKLHTHIREVSHKNRTHFTYNIHKKYRKNTPLRIFTQNFVCVCTN